MHNLSLFVVPGFVAHMHMYINAGCTDESRNITNTSSALAQQTIDFQNYRLYGGDSRSGPSKMSL